MANDNLENTLIKQFGNSILPIQPEDFEEIKAAIKKDEAIEKAKYPFNRPLSGTSNWKTEPPQL